MVKNVLIITNRDDLHADIVTSKIAALSGKPFRLNLDEFPAHFSIDLSFVSGRWDGTLSYMPTGNSVSISDIGAVWLRKKADFSFASGHMAPQERAYAEAETEHILFGLLYSLDCYWMSHPLATRSALWKGEQQFRAARMGFNVPASAITNRGYGIDALWESADNGVVFKALSSPALAADEVGPEDRLAAGLPTTLITQEDKSALSSVEDVPCFFQHYVPKDYELRVTVIGDRVFAAKIHSQDDPRTEVDFRDYSAEILYEAEALPTQIEQRCIDFVHSYDMTYGALDLIVTPDGEYVFLENNPVGQFLFVEQLVPELDMTGAVAKCLIEGTEQIASRS